MTDVQGAWRRQRVGHVVQPAPKLSLLPVPPVPPVVFPAPTPVVSRFTLEAQDPVDRLVAVLVNVGKDREAAEKAFAELKQELTPEKVKQLPGEKRAMAYYFATRLGFYGLRLARYVMRELRTKPSSDLALAWYNLALREEGWSSRIVVPIGDEASEYIAWKWKVGRRKRPESGEWSLVP